MRILAVLIAALATLALGPQPIARAAPAANTYDDPAAWLCRPGSADACAGDLKAVVLSPSGAMTRHGFATPANPPVDCFYVYPTVSREPASNADMTAGPEEAKAARSQFSLFGARCRLYAPLYRQVTLAALFGRTAPGDTELAYEDVRDAWNDYLVHDNHGRGVVLIGHSQGAKILTRLVAEEIDGKPAQGLLVSAILPGGEIGVPAGQVVGGAFRHIPLCERADQAGCLIAYSSYLADAPLGSDADFGQDPGPGLHDACVNPAELLGRTTLDAELPAVGQLGDALDAAFIENPGMLSARCTREGERSYLAISVAPGADLLRAELADLQKRGGGFGLHPLDVNLALGDLVELVGRQSAAWAAAR